jgi:L-lactate dehydrogenase (cytochrome)/(S)-mandelate dehydrogenase
MNFNQAINIEDLHRIAKRKLPKIIFDYIEGGVEDERGLARNEAAFHKHRLLPRYLVDVSKRDQSATVFGRAYASPFGISPTGGVGLYRREGEVMLAQAAAEANIPYIMSGGSNASMEEALRVAPNNVWFQLYAAKDGSITDALIGRARDGGAGALVLTVDVPVHPKRERNYRSGFARVQGGGRRQSDGDARQRCAARRRHPDRVLPRRPVRVLRPADALRRRRRRASGCQEGDQHLSRRDRSRHGSDRLPEP